MCTGTKLLKCIKLTCVALEDSQKVSTLWDHNTNFISESIMKSRMHWHQIKLFMHIIPVLSRQNDWYWRIYTKTCMRGWKLWPEWLWHRAGHGRSACHSKQGYTSTYVAAWSWCLRLCITGEWHHLNKWCNTALCNIPIPDLTQVLTWSLLCC